MVQREYLPSLITCPDWRAPTSWTPSSAGNKCGSIAKSQVLTCSIPWPLIHHDYTYMGMVALGMLRSKAPTLPH